LVVEGKVRLMVQVAHDSDRPTRQSPQHGQWLVAVLTGVPATVAALFSLALVAGLSASYGNPLREGAGWWAFGVILGLTIAGVILLNVRYVFRRSVSAVKAALVTSASVGLVLVALYAVGENWA
jgi:hypothetical protein